MSKSPVYIGAGSSELAVQSALNFVEDAIDSAKHLVTIADWVHLTDGTTVIDRSTGVDSLKYSAKEYAQGSTLAAGGSAKNWATLATTPTTTAGDASAKEWATGVSTHKGDASSKEYATHAKYGTVDGSAEYSALHYSAQAKDWAVKTTIVRNDANGANVDYSSKEWAAGQLAANTSGSARQWALGGGNFVEATAVTGSLYSAKRYASLAAADLVLTNADVVSAEADKVQTGLDRIAVAADLVATNQDTIDTAADLVATNQDTIDTAADVVLTHADEVLTRADTVLTAADVVLTHADVVLTNADVVSAAASATSAEGYTDSFDDKYLGSHTTASREVGANVGKDNDGDALDDGALYYDTTLEVMKVWDDTGSVWKQLTPTASNQTNIDAAVADAVDIGAVAGVATEIGLLGTSAHATATTGNLAKLGAGFDGGTGTSGTTSNLALINTVSTSIANVNTFVDRYRVAANADLPLPNLDAGDLYFNTNTNELNVYNATTSAWQQATPNQSDIDSINIVAGNLIYQEDLGSITTAVTTSSVTNEIGKVAALEDEIERLGTAPMSTATTGSIALLGTSAMAHASTGYLKLVGDIDDKVTIVGSITVGDVTKVANITTGDVTKVASITTGDVTKVANITTGDVTKVADVDGEVILVAAIDGEIALIGTAAMATASTGHLAYLGTSAMANTTNGYLKVLGNATVTADLAILGSTTVTDDMALLAVPAVITDMDLLGATGVIGDMDLIGATGVIGDIETVADSIGNVNRYANEYVISSTAPTSPTPTAGDLWYDTSTNVIKYHTGSAFAVALGMTSLIADTSPELGGTLESNNNNFTEVGTISGDNLQIDFGTIT